MCKLFGHKYETAAVTSRKRCVYSVCGRCLFLRITKAMGLLLAVWLPQGCAADATSFYGKGYCTADRASDTVVCYRADRSVQSIVVVK